MKRRAFAGRAKELGDRFAGLAPAVLTFSEPEDLHKMRVAGRSMLACISLLPKPERRRRKCKALEKMVRRHMTLLGRARDLDVLLGELGSRAELADPAYAELLAAWTADVLRERDEARAELSSKLPGLARPQFTRLLAAWQERLYDMKGFDPEGRLKKLRSRFKAAYAALEYVGAADDAFLDSLHATRIKAKRLRYALALAGDARDEIEQLKALQDLLGAVQDRRVWLERLGQYRTRYPEAVEQLSQVLKAELVRSIDELAQSRAKPW